jgi:hypothetical protein
LGQREYLISRDINNNEHAEMQNASVTLEGIIPVITVSTIFHFATFLLAFWKLTFVKTQALMWTYYSE